MSSGASEFKSERASEFESERVSERISAAERASKVIEWEVRANERTSEGTSGTSQWPITLRVDFIVIPTIEQPVVVGAFFSISFHGWLIWFSYLFAQPLNKSGDVTN